MNQISLFIPSSIMKIVWSLCDEDQMVQCMNYLAANILARYSVMRFTYFWIKEQTEQEKARVGNNIRLGIFIHGLNLKNGHLVKLICEK